MASYKISVDRALCIGSGSCVLFAGQTFELDSECKAAVSPGQGDDIEDIKLAADNCPTRAIFVKEE
ncbi:MAG: ferredoxin [bacterium]|nr:ferredoxin [bacterium]